MPFNKNFCPSPWFHMRITNSGSYEYCRWMIKDKSSKANSIQTQEPLDYFQNTLSDIRTQFLEGGAPAGCADCRIMEDNNKVSGRQRQLLKVGVRDEYFEKSLLGSPMRESFDYSDQNQGHTTRTVSDWQIDLGNYCNSACVFCSPRYSSRLATEFKQLGLIEQVPTSSWCDDPALLTRFINNLTDSTELRYLHFIGGETLITPGFEKILQALVDADMAQHITIGFTTNLTVWSDRIVELLLHFDQINLGLSVESLNNINDYVRWPSKIERTQALLDRWVQLAHQHSWLVQLRVTPTVLSVHDLVSVYNYAWSHGLNVESCNFISNPAFMRIGVLPLDVRVKVAATLRDWVSRHPAADADQVINTRNPNMAKHQLRQDVASYINYLETAPDETCRLPDLMAYLKKLESNRGNSIIDYLPQYENLFRSNGY